MAIAHTPNLLYGAYNIQYQANTTSYCWHSSLFRSALKKTQLKRGIFVKDPTVITGIRTRSALMAGSTTSIPAAKKTMDMITPKVIQVTAIQAIIPTAATQSVILIRREVTAKGSVDTVDTVDIVYVVGMVTVNTVDMVTVNAVDMVDTVTVNAVDMVDMVTENMVDMVTVNAVDMVDTVKVGNDERKVIQAQSEMDYGQGHAVL